MRVKIKLGSAGKYNDQHRQKLQQVEGQWLEIDIEYLFPTQYNTKPIPGIAESGLRIYAADVEEIDNDERKGRSRCGYCGLWATTGEVCPGCNKGTDEMKEFFPGTKRVTGMEDEVTNILGSIINM